MCISPSRLKMIESEYLQIAKPCMNVSVFCKTSHVLNSFRWNHYYKQSDKITQGQERQWLETGGGREQGLSMSWELRTHLNKHGKRPPPKRVSNTTHTSPDFLPSLLMWTWFTRRCRLFAWHWKRHQRRTDRKSELSLVLRPGNVPALWNSASFPRYIFPSSISLKPPTANRKYTIFSLKNICKTVYSYNSVDLPRLHKNPRWDAMQWDADDSVDGAGCETGWCDIQQTFHGIYIYIHMIT